MTHQKNNPAGHKKHLLRPLIATIVLAVFLFFGNSVEIIGAQDGASDSGSFPYPFQDTTTPVDTACEPEMKVFAAQKLQEYLGFIQKTFQNKSSTGSLLSIAIAKYRQLREELLIGYSKYVPRSGALQLTVGLQPGACLKIVQDTLADARRLLKIHAVRTSGVKKATALLEKYQSINSKLQELNRQFVNMKALLDSFEAKLPCYIKKGSCVKG